LNILVITTLYPGDQGETPKDISFAVHKLVIGLERFGVNVKKVIKPKHLIYWRTLSLKTVNYSTSIDAVTVHTKTFFNLPKVGFKPSKNDWKFLEENLQGVDLVVTHMPIGGEMASLIFKKFNVPFIHVVHGTDLLFPNKLKLIANRARYIFARSESIERYLEDYGYPVAGICFSGIERDIILPLEHAMKRERSKGEVFKVISVCNLQKLKNLDVVLQSLAELDKNISWIYTIIGDGSERESLRKKVSELGISRCVRMLGYKNREACLGLMSESNVFIMPSAPETFGLAYLEAMASGCVVIGAQGWGIDGVIKHGFNGYLVAPRDHAKIVQTLETIWSNSQAEVIGNSLATIKNYTDEEATKNYARMIQL
jgi:glycosyltransferase involved in cell wall biosynthesis